MRLMNESNLPKSKRTRYLKSKPNSCSNVEEIHMPKPKRTRYLKKKPKPIFHLDEVIRNQGLQHIPKSIFKCLDIKTLLNCREVSKNLKNVLDDPWFWFKMCIQHKMPEVHQIEWKKLILLFQASNTETKLTKYLIKTFFSVKQEKNFEFYGLYKSPVNLACKYGEIEILKAFKSLNVLKDVIKTADKEIHNILYKRNKDDDSNFELLEPYLEEEEYHLPFHIACENGHLDIVKMLGRIYTDPTDRNPFYLSSLDYAVSGNQHHVMEYIMGEKEYDYDISNYEVSDQWGSSLFHRAARCSDTKMLNMLIQKIDDFGYSFYYDIIAEARYIGDNTVLMAACESGDLEKVEIIYDYLEEYHGEEDLENIQKPGEFKDTPLHIAAMNGHFEIVKFLISKGADPLKGNNFPLLPIIYAINTDRTRDVHWGGDSWSNSTPITYSDGHLKTIEYLAELTFKERHFDLNDLNIAMRATNSLIVVKTLLKYAKEETFQAKLVCGKNSIIHLAARYGNLEVLKLLLPYVKGLEIEPYLKVTGMTPIHFAATNGHFEVVKLLSSYTSKVNVANREGLTPIDFAKLDGYTEIANYLDRMAKKTKFSEFDGNISLNLLSQF